jgi:hypothetical protein
MYMMVTIPRLIKIQTKFIEMEEMIRSIASLTYESYNKIYMCHFRPRNAGLTSHNVLGSYRGYQ